MNNEYRMLLFYYYFYKVNFFNLNLDILNFFDTLSLSYLQDKAPLLNRKDRKFIIPIAIFDKILIDCLAEYQILKINTDLLFRYRTNYYDTRELKLYFDHHKGKGNRYKIREREYVQSGLKYFEIKCKTSKDYTIKHRMEAGNRMEAKEFIQNHTGILESDLHNTLNLEYSRITLLHKIKKEKVTLDLNLNFHGKHHSISFDNIVIAEVKIEQFATTEFGNIMKKYKIRPSSLSKYCLGLLSLNPKLKRNNFKMIFNQIVKINNNE